MFAYFNSVPEKGFVYNFGNDEPLVKAPLPEQQAQLSVLDEKVRQSEKRLEALQPRIRKARHAWEKNLSSAAPIDWAIEDGQVFHDPLNARAFDGKNFIDAGATVAKFDYQDPFTFSAWIKPENNRGAILSKADDYFEGQGHGLYLIDGKVRL